MADTFDFTTDKSGKITRTWNSLFSMYQYVGALYSTSTVNCAMGQNYNLDPTHPAQYVALFQFDTSSIPDDATVTVVEFKTVYAASQPSGSPELETWSWYIGDIIGATFNGNSGEFSGGTFMTARSEGDIPAEGDWVDLSEYGNDPTGYVSLTGTTDIRIDDLDSSRGSGDASWGVIFNGLKAKCQLRVTYELPATDTPLRAMMGVGLCILGWFGINWNPFLRTKVFNPL